MEDMVAEALLFGDAESQVLAAKNIAELSNKQRQKLAEKGAISPLVSMLHSQDYDSTEAALFALLNLAFGSERSKVRIAKAGAIPTILQVLQCQNESLSELAAAALLILSSCSANKLEIASSGAIQLLIQLLNLQFPTQNLTIRTKLDLISTLHNLSTCPQIIPSIILSDGVVTLLELIYGLEKSSELVEKVVALLEKLVSSSDIALKQAAEAGGGIQVLVEAMEEGSEVCKEHAVGVLLLICQSSRERHRGVILREGAMPGILQMSVDGSWRGREKAKALLLLLRDNNKSCCGSRNKQSKNVMLEQVMRQIDRGERSGTSLKMVEDIIAKLRT